MNRDRGNIKWNALMLPEHVKLLREWKAEDSKTEKPELTQWQLEEINNELQWAYEGKYPITVTYWQDEKLHTFTSVIAHYKQHEQKLYFTNNQAVNIQQIVRING